MSDLANNLKRMAQIQALDLKGLVEVHWNSAIQNKAENKMKNTYFYHLLRPLLCNTMFNSTSYLKE